MNRTLVLIPLLVALGACSSAPSEEELADAKKLAAVADDYARDQDKREDGLARAQAECEARRRDALDAWAAKHEKAALDRLTLLATMEQSIEEGWQAIRSARHAAVDMAELAARLQDPAASDEERHELEERVAIMSVELRAARRESELAKGRYEKNDATLKKALEADKAAAPH
jgi:hypothetical protein